MSKHQLFEGFITHRRIEPKLNEFRYKLFQFYFDLDYINELKDVSPLLSLERLNYISFYRKNYFIDQQSDLKATLLEYIGIQNNHSNYKVYLLTHLSFAGFCFNPISLYFIYKNGIFTSMIAEVTNTPWHERHLYILDTPTRSTPPIYYFTAKKSLHVSPFMSMNYDYDFKLKKTNEDIILHISNRQEQKVSFFAILSMNSKPLTKSNLHACLRRYPLLTQKIVSLIHWHALKLWAKGVPFHSHPKTK